MRLSTFCGLRRDQEQFSEEKKLGKNTFVSCFVKLHYFAEFRSVSFRVMEWTLPKYSESHGMSTLFRGITKTVPSLFRGIFSERNFDGNPSINSPIYKLYTIREYRLSAINNAESFRWMIRRAILRYKRHAELRLSLLAATWIIYLHSEQQPRIDEKSRISPQIRSQIFKVFG